MKRPYYSFDVLLPHGEKEDGWECEWPACGPATWERIVTAQAHRCFYCANLVLAEMTRDHLRPICRGGCHCVGNLVGACPSCNSMKRHMSIGEFLRARPSFLLTMGEFSTRVLYLSRDRFFWEKLKPRIAEIAALKRLPPINTSVERRIELQEQKLAVYRGKA